MTLLFVGELKMGERAGVLSHPCDKNKYVAWMGHPSFLISNGWSIDLARADC